MSSSNSPDATASNTDNLESQLNNLFLPPASIQNLQQNKGLWNDLTSLHHLSFRLKEWEDAYKENDTLDGDPDILDEELEDALTQVLATTWPDTFPSLNAFVNESDQNKEMIALVLGPIRARGMEYGLCRQKAVITGLLIETMKMRRRRRANKRKCHGIMTGAKC